MRVLHFDPGSARAASPSAVGIVATGHYLPARVVATDALGLPDPDELVRLTGVRSRHVAAPEEATSDLVIAACRAALTGFEEDAGGRPAIDRVLVATVTPDHPSPATAPLVQHGLGLDQVPAMDLSAACAGFVYALDLAARAVLTGDRAVLVGAGECRVRTLERAAPGVRVLFGDGAAAAVVGPLDAPSSERPAGRLPRLALVATALGADGRGHDAIRVAAGGSRRPASAETVADGLHALAMSDGPHVFFRAVEGFVDIAHALLREVSLAAADLALVVPHQPNLRILERVSRLMRVPLERFALEVDAIGNVGGASVGIALDRALRAGRVRPGDKVLLLTAGAGYTAAAALLEARP